MRAQGVVTWVCQQQARRRSVGESRTVVLASCCCCYLLSQVQASWCARALACLCHAASSLLTFHLLLPVSRMYSNCRPYSKVTTLESDLHKHGICLWFRPCAVLAVNADFEPSCTWTADIQAGCLRLWLCNSLSGGHALVDAACAGATAAVLARAGWKPTAAVRPLMPNADGQRAWSASSG